MTTCAGSTASEAAPTRTSTWTPIGALMSGIAVVVGSEFLPASVLPDLAAGVGVTEGQAGLAVTATALAGAVTAPSIAPLLPRVDRRHLLIGLLLLGAVADLVVAVAPDFAVLLVGRVLLGVALSGFWTFAFGAGINAVPGRDRTVASALAFGVGVATVVGIPIASTVGDQIGWRATFAGAAGLSVISAGFVFRTLPSTPPGPSAGLAMLRGVLGHRLMLGGIACVVLVAFGNFTAYPFIRLAIDRVDASSTAWVLLVWGAGGVAGTLLAGALAARLRPLAAATPVLLGLALATTAAAASLPLLVVAILVWGVAFNMVPVMSQLWAARVEPERIEAALSLQVTAFQVAISAGSAVGGALVDGYGVRSALLIGTIAAVAAGAGWALLRLPDR